MPKGASGRNAGDSERGGLVQSVSQREFSRLVSAEIREEITTLQSADKKLQDRIYQLNRAKSQLQTYTAEKLGNKQYDQQAVSDGILTRTREVARAEKNIQTAQRRKQTAQGNYDIARESAERVIRQSYFIIGEGRSYETPIQRQRRRN